MVARGDAHIVTQDTLTRDRMWLMDNASDAEVLARPGPGMALLDFNHSDPLWQNEATRRAIAPAVDRPEIEETADPGVPRAWEHYLLGSKIGRASWRERGEGWE